MDSPVNLCSSVSTQEEEKLYLDAILTYKKLLTKILLKLYWHIISVLHSVTKPISFYTILLSLFPFDNSLFKRVLKLIFVAGLVTWPFHGQVFKNRLA